MKKQDNNWQDSLETGTKGEEEVVNHMNKIKPEWKVTHQAGANKLDATSVIGGWEIKTYDDWYRNPLIEVACVSGVGDTMWKKDDRITVICLNHFGWLHMYNANKMRDEWKKGTFEKHAYTKWVEQEAGGRKKEMQFFSIKDCSSLPQHFCNWDDDPKRWNMAVEFKGRANDNPYITSIPMQKRIAPLPKTINLKLLRSVFNELQIGKG